MFLGSGEDFCVFHHIWAWWPSYLMMQNGLNKLIICLERRPSVISGENW